MLLRLEMIENKDQRDREFKMALLNIENIEPTSIFPDLVIKDGNDDDEEDLLPDPEDGTVMYDFSNAEFDPKKVEEEIAEMLARASQGSASFETEQSYTGWI